MPFTAQSQKVEFLAAQILLHKHRYYSGVASVPDSVYDALEDELRSLEPNHPVLSIVGDAFSKSAQKVPHDPPMLSLNKTYSPQDLFDFIAKQPTVMSEKFDGMALAIEYNSKGLLFRASTRGNGKIGEDATIHLLHMEQLPRFVKISELEKHDLVLEVRGEAYFPISEFKPFAERFDSYRNAVPGTFGRKDASEAADILKVLKFCSYDFILKSGDGKPLTARQAAEIIPAMGSTFFERLRWIESFGFYAGISTGRTKLLTQNNFLTAENLHDELSSLFAANRDYQIDGIVFRYNDDVNWERLGVTSHHPRGSIAFKQASEVASTKIVAIEENIGRSGKITFRAKLEPVSLSGATITYATLHNAEFIESAGYAPGAIVKITRSGEVIPYIVGLEKAAPTPYVIPTACPCGYSAVRRGPDLFCGEKINCARKDQESLVYFVHTLEIMGVSDKIVLKMREAGLVQQPSDLYKLTVEDLLSLEGFAQKSAENVVNAIQGKRHIPLAQFLAALGLKRGGIVKCQEVARKFKTLAAVRKASASDLLEEKGWAEKSAEDLFESLTDKSDAIDELLKFVTVEDDSTVLATNDNHPYFGKTICITGSLSKSRDEYIQKLESIGAKVTDAVSKKTSFLVCNESSGSSKYKKAQELGVPIITEAQLVENLG